MAIQGLRALCLAFPYDQNRPPLVLKRVTNSLIAGRVAFQLGFPELNTGLRHVGEPASGVPVPKAAVHKHNEFVAGKGDIRTTRKVPAVQPEAIAKSMKRTPDGQLRSGVPRANARHHSAALRVYADQFAHVGSFIDNLGARRSGRAGLCGLSPGGPRGGIERAPAGTGARTSGPHETPSAATMSPAE
jgi:hypothetical protein